MRRSKPLARRNRSGHDARIGELPYGMEERAMDEIKFILKHHASEINQIESAIGRPLVFGAIKAFNAQDWRDEVEITLDGQPVGADFESFISGVLWLLKQ